MLARLQQLAAGLWLAALLAWPAWLWQLGCSGWAAAAALGLLLGHGLWLAVGLALAHALNRHDPAPRAQPGQLLRAWWGEFRLAPQVFFWRQPFRWRAVPDHLPAEAAGRTGVLLVHGFVCNRGLWNPWLRRLRAAGHPFVALSLEPVFGSIDDYVPLIEAAVRQLEVATGQAPVVVAHSMGGLAVRAWLAGGHTEGRVQEVITLGTPHHGTWLGRWALSDNGRQMRLDSDWLQALAAREPASRRRLFTCFYSHCDNIVFPASSACLPDARHRHLPATAHVDLVLHPLVMAHLLHRLSARG
jgi:triacylglycerol lipase